MLLALFFITGHCPAEARPGRTEMLSGDDMSSDVTLALSLSVFKNRPKTVSAAVSAAATKLFNL